MFKRLKAGFRPLWSGAAAGPDRVAAATAPATAPVMAAEMAAGDRIAAQLAGFSIEVMPRTAAKIADFRDLLPAGTRVYIAHIEGTPIADMVATARRLSEQGFAAMPHFPARLIQDRAMLQDWLARYRDAGVRQGLLLAGGPHQPRGDYHSAMQLLESGAFAGFERLHVAGHPEGNRDIDPDGGERSVMAAARWKADFAARSDAQMAMVTQFCFEAAPVLAWTRRLRAEGIDLPVHIGLAGPAKLQTLIRFAIACGIGPSLRVLQKRALDVTKLLLPYEPDQMLADLAMLQAAEPDSAIEQVHLFPLGGIRSAAEWTQKHGQAPQQQAAQGPVPT